jgi:hypothetical protein
MILLCISLCLCALKFAHKKSGYGDNYNSDAPSFICSAQRKIVRLNSVQTRLSMCSQLKGSPDSKEQFHTNLIFKHMPELLFFTFYGL